MATDDPTDGPVGERKSDRTRERILAAARNVFAHKGFSGVTITDVTRPARVTRANFYYYFQDKTQLFVELGTATYLEALTVVESFSDLTDPTDRTEIRLWVDRYFDYLNRNGAFVVRSSEDAPADKRFRASVARSHRRTAQALGERIAKLAVTPLDIDSHAMGLVVMSAMERTWLQLTTQSTAALSEALAKDALCELIARLLG